MGALDTAPHVHVDDRDAWRRWLEANHATASGVWLVSWRPASGRGRIDYEAAVEEALCFGWIDGQAATVDAQRSKQYFSPRRPRSPWVSSNRERIARLLDSGRMAPAGIAAIERAKADGSWSILESSERLELPPDLAAALEARPPARDHWEAFPRSVKRGLLAWIALARRDATRARRVEATAAAAQRNERANER
jgi:uncharacterized protein YdeI (YjbR/CyaY-like superfamily)